MNWSNIALGGLLGFFTLAICFSVLFPVLQSNPEFRDTSLYKNSSLYATRTDANTSQFTQYQLNQSQTYSGYVSGVQGIYNNQSTEEPQKGTERGAIERTKFSYTLIKDVLAKDTGMGNTSIGQSMLYFIGALTGIMLTIATLRAYFGRRY